MKCVEPFPWSTICEARSLNVDLSRYCTWCSSDVVGLVGSLVCFVSVFVYYFSVQGRELVTRVASLWQVPALLSHLGVGTCHMGGFVVTSFRSLIAPLWLHCDKLPLSFAARGWNLSQGRLRCDKFLPSFRSQGGNLSHGRLRCDKLPYSYRSPGRELVTRAASLRRPRDNIEREKKRVWLRLCFKLVVFVGLVLFDSWFVFWYFRFALLW